MKEFPIEIESESMPRHKHYDPVTGDELSRGERISWRIQGIIRNWTFLILFTAITLLIWSTDNSTMLLWWNLVASFLAIMIESIVGLSMYGQTRRDAVVMRKVRAISEHIEQMNELLLTNIDTLEAQENRTQQLEQRILTCMEEQQQFYLAFMEGRRITRRKRLPHSLPLSPTSTVPFNILTLAPTPTPTPMPTLDPIQETSA